MSSSFLRASAVLLLAVAFLGGEVRGQAPNDTCATAFVAVDGANPGNNNGSSVGTDPMPACTTMNNDVWFSYTASCTGTVTATTCAPATNFDTLLAAWTGACGCLSEIACNDDACPLGKSTITFSTVVGVTYYISLGGFDGGAGSFVLNISCAPGPFLVPPNDHCGVAAPIVEGVVTPGTTVNATTGGGGACPGDPTGTCSVMANDVWFVFVASCSGVYEAWTCFAATSFDTVVAVWDGSAGCGNLVEVGCNDTAGCTIINQGNTAIASWNATAGTAYYVSVGGFIGFTGTFDLWVGASQVPRLSFFDYGPGTIGFTIANGPPSGIAFTAITVNPGSFPNGGFFGIDISLQEVMTLASIGFPFFTPLGTCGELTAGPTGGAPSGIVLYAVTLTAVNANLVLSTWSAPVSVTIP